MNNQLDWIPSSCSLPIAEQPLRVAEFDDLFATSVRAVDRVGPTTLHLSLDPGSQEQAKELTARESDCCSFFGFELTPADADSITLKITVPPVHTKVLDAVAARAANLIARGN
jgi:hypothetical protein